MKPLIVIPARYGSTRFPAKPLHKIMGRTLLERVVNIAKQVQKDFDCQFVVATDHNTIQDHCKDINAPVVMTDPELKSGTDRALAALDACGLDADFIINMQGDAPFTPVQHVVSILDVAKNLDADVFTPVIQLDWEALDVLRQRKLKTPYSGTTCVRSENGYAFWFSKTIQPAIRKEKQLRDHSAYSPVYRHIGLYGYRLEALKRFSNLPMGNYETLEGLEQLRFLENGMSIYTVCVETPIISMSGVDTPEDAELAAELIKKHGDPFATL